MTLLWPDWLWTLLALPLLVLVYLRLLARRKKNNVRLASVAIVRQALGSGPTGNEYADGWEIAVDDDGNGAVASNETRVRRNTATLEKIKLGGDVAVAFRATGALVGTSAQVFTLCQAGGGTRGYTVTVMPSGTTDVARIDTCTP